MEEAIKEEKASTDHNWDSDLLSHEQRLQQRLDKLKLDMFIMGSDGACQVRYYLVDGQHVSLDGQHFTLRKMPPYSIFSYDVIGSRILHEYHHADMQWSLVLVLLSA